MGSLSDIVVGIPPARTQYLSRGDFQIRKCVDFSSYIITQLTDDLTEDFIKVLRPLGIIFPTENIRCKNIEYFL